MRTSTFIRSTTFSLTLALGGLWGVSAQADELAKDVLSKRVAQNNASAKSQAAIDRMSSESDDKLAELRQELETISNLKKFNERLRRLIASQESEKVTVQRDIDGVTNVERNILPLMDRMVDTLAEFVSLDTPFYSEERADRITNLRELMERADVTVAEKYRRLTEAYQIENEFGRTMDAYTGELEDGKTVEFLRVGRVLLVYRTADGDEMGYWDNGGRQWAELSGSYRSAVDEGIRIARKQAPPDLVTLPILYPATEGR